MDVLEEEMEKQRQARAMMEAREQVPKEGGEAMIVRRDGGLSVEIRSKYEVNDEPTGGHTQVWGSYWHPVNKWGYKCCKSFSKESNCYEEKNKVIEPP
jgi:hypothetical protein